MAEVKTNHENENLWCLCCKEHIEVGHKYILVLEQYDGEIIEKAYHCSEECAPEEDEDLYIPEPEVE